MGWGKVPMKPINAKNQLIVVLTNPTGKLLLYE